MKWLWENPGPVWQWIGLAATLAGTALSVWAVLAARSARRAAEEARMAATRLGRVTQITDLAADMQELETFIAAENVQGIASKANHLRARIARFSAECGNELTAGEREHLVAAQSQLALMVRQIAESRATDRRKLDRIRIVVGDASAALHAVVGQRRSHSDFGNASSGQVPE